jgi:iron complex transport system permease protein
MAIVSIVFMVSIRSGQISGLFLLLTGIALSYFVSSIVAFLLFSNIRLQNEAFFWLLGSIGLITIPELIITIPVMAICMILSFIFYKELNALQMGDEYARSVGVNVNFSKGMFLILTALSVSAAVSISGLIGFVGLIIPHISRLIFGGSNKLVIPSSAIIGATFLLICNDIARDIARPEILPIGIVTGLLGVPIFVMLMMRISRGAYET